MKTKHHISLLLLAISFFISCKNGVEQIDSDPETEQRAPGIGKARDISSFDLVNEMGVGWNLGNSFDVTSRDKTLWGNPLTTKAIIDKVKEMGFKTLRIPVTWGFNQDESPPYSVELQYLEEVKKVVDFGFKNKMHVIINVHHDDYWVVPTQTEAQKTKERLKSLWTQIADFFEVYNDSLIFETLNEPRLIGIPEEWTGGTPEGRNILNEFHQTAVNAIRNSGGNNKKRHIMITPWAASALPVAMNDLEIPNNDSKIIISIHNYYPWQFAGEASSGWGSEQDKQNLKDQFDMIRQKWIIEKNRPVILGEWGSIDKNNLQSRIEYANFYVAEATKRGLLTLVWDDGGRFRLLNRNTKTWDYEEIASTIIDAAKN